MALKLTEIADKVIHLTERCKHRFQRIKGRKHYDYTASEFQAKLLDLWEREALLEETGQ